MSPPELETGTDVALPILRVSSFRAFRDDTELQLRPLTLLYGHNQSGKSSLLRLLPLLADSLHKGPAGLDMLSPSLLGATFKEIGWMGRSTPAYTPKFVIQTPDDDLYEVQFARETGHHVNRLKIGRRGAPDRFSVSLDDDAKKASSGKEARYAGMHRGRDWFGSLRFPGLLPEGLPGDIQSIVDDVIASMRPLKGVQWLHAGRLGRGVDRSAHPVRWCKSDGSDLADVLRDQADVLEHASSWMRDTDALDESVRVGVDTDGRPRLELRHPEKDFFPLHLAGEGLRSLLPILLCACWAEKGDNGPTALAVEEPEAHLHPNLQVALMDRLIDTVSKGIPVILETHSVYLLRAMQLAVLKGRIASDDVALYWVEQDGEGVARVKPVEVEPDATLKDWLPATFEQEQELAHKILDQRWSRKEAP